MLKEFKINAEMYFVRDWKEIEARGCLDVDAQRGVKKMAIDPVCGMKVEEKTAKWFSDYKGKKYYFCNLHDKREFDKSPEKYVSKEGKEQANK